MDYEYKRSGQIPAFGNWDYANELPITQYFESARQAGLLRHSSFSGDADLYGGAGGGDLYDTVDVLQKPTRSIPQRKTRVRERRGAAQIKEQRKQVKVCDDVTEPPTKSAVSQRKGSQDDAVSRTRKVPPPKAPKAVDEDLYKIPPEWLSSTSRPKRKKMLGFISKCLVPACSA